MKEKYQKIWDVALPFQDKRDDKGHSEVVTEYAIKMCSLEEVNPDIVVPAAILHDIGWSKLTKEERMSIFDKNLPRETYLEMRYKHQEEGVKLARQILENLNYDEKLIPEILEIISQHDTREGFISNNEGAMRDADKLWRYDKRGFLSDRTSTNLTEIEHLEKLRSNLSDTNFFYFDSAKELATNLLPKLEAEFGND